MHSTKSSIASIFSYNTDYSFPKDLKENFKRTLNDLSKSHKVIKERKSEAN